MEHPEPVGFEIFLGIAFVIVCIVYIIYKISTL